MKNYQNFFCIIMYIISSNQVIIYLLRSQINIVPSVFFLLQKFPEIINAPFKMIRAKNFLNYYFCPLHNY